MIIKDYQTLKEAFDYFNLKLFDNKLPNVVVILQRKPHSFGYFGFEHYKTREGNDRASVIALNPDTFNGRTDKDILSTFVHEMVHLQQFALYDHPKAGYHDKVWANLMEDIGLMPSSTGEEGGKRTGQKVSHYIIEGDKFDTFCDAFLIEHSILWEAIIADEKEKKDKKKSSRKKYTCPVCLTNIWAKSDVSVLCGECNEKFIVEENDENEKEPE